MKNHIIRILFLVVKNRLNKEGKSTIKCRITFSHKRKEYSTGQFINPQFRNSKQKFAEPREPDAEGINTELSQMKTKLNQDFEVPCHLICRIQNLLQLFGCKPLMIK